MEPTSSDRDIVRAVLAGDRNAFGPLVARHRRAAIVCALAFVGSEDAEDIAQDAFVRAYARLATCRDHDRFLPWLLAIVRHLALNHRRAAGRRPVDALPDDVAAPGAGADAVLGHRQRLRSAFGVLSPVEREVLLLADLEQLSHRDIARRTGVSVFMSRRHLSAARRKIRDHLRSTHGE